ncbi:unnamed protein product [Notodromas monacha]|uniref:7-dehydrocholesterol reductase n=1 Tax=Notodromas monacha TaxID=399045 RepID=A0A7R9BS16_9CRUS|nr:unnamed protein product [Notodromas monacha]CAG0919249.1 unnamed protein product [Notodromas monacha]
MYDTIRYHVIPPAFVVFFTGVVQYLAWSGRGASVDFSALWGNEFAWRFLGVSFAWAYVSLLVPSRKCKGPVTDFGQVPEYQDNGTLYYWATLVTFVLYNFFVDKDLSLKIYDNFPQILGALNTCALLLCVVLLIKGRLSPDVREKTVMKKFPIAYEFYSGKELHPRLLGVDVKQFTNCRFGMVAWQIFILAFFFAGIKREGFNYGFAVNVLLQSIYVAKFWWWESGYFWTLDVALDRAGYYLCWGCLVWVPVLYTFSSYFMVAHPPLTSPLISLLIFFVGLSAVIINYAVDREKEIFRKTGGECEIRGEPAKYIDVEYVDEKKRLRKSKLLISGFWGTLRHLNYNFEILAAFSWSCVGWHHGLAPFYYVVFLTGLLVHRVFRDEEKCRRKYGKYWEKYCSIVRYRMIPYVF